MRPTRPQCIAIWRFNSNDVSTEIREQLLEEYRNEAIEVKSLADFEARQNGLRSLQSNVNEILHDLGGGIMRERVLATGERIDGRASDQIRPIACEVRPFPRPHGVALFTRGETQAIVVTTLGTGRDAQIIDAIEGVERVEMQRPESCCGSAGIYSLLRPTDSRAVLEPKLAELGDTGAEVLVTANPGCQLQWAAGVRRQGAGVEVLHVAELLERALKDDTQT